MICTDTETFCTVPTATAISGTLLAASVLLPTYKYSNGTDFLTGFIC
jgi:hypothetical protein